MSIVTVTVDANVESVSSQTFFPESVLPVFKPHSLDPYTEFCCLTTSIEEYFNGIDDIFNIATCAELNNKYNSMFNLDNYKIIDDQFLSESEVTQFVLDNSRLDGEGRHEIAIQ